jgi:hypothetical protein
MSDLNVPKLESQKILRLLKPVWQMLEMIKFFKET